MRDKRTSKDVCGEATLCRSASLAFSFVSKNSSAVLAFLGPSTDPKTDFPTLCGYRYLYQYKSRPPPKVAYMGSGGL